MPPRIRLLLMGLAVWVGLAPDSRGQVPLTPAESARVEQFLARPSSGGHLACSIQPRQPFLDFSFRFNVGYILQCPLRVLAGRASAVSAYTRVVPEGGLPVTFGVTYQLPEISPETARAVNSNFKGGVEVSGGFAAGEGRYAVDVFLVERATHRTYRKHWRVRVARRRSQRAVPEAIAPGAVSPLASQPWPGQLDTSGKGLRVAIWLNAAATSPRAPRLRMWDRTFLLASLSSLLSHLPCASVRLVAFNLDQQREVFRQEHLDRQGFLHLDKTLQALELGTVSYRVLQQRDGGLDMLLDMANREVTAEEPSDFVIILGPRTHYMAAVGRERVKARETHNPHFCYFQFFPQPGFPDTLHNLTRRLEGSVYEIYSPGDFARAIQKMLAQMQASRSATAQNR